MFQGVFAMRFHLVVNVVNVTVNGIYIANNFLLLLDKLRLLNQVDILPPDRSS